MLSSRLRVQVQELRDTGLVLWELLGWPRLTSLLSDKFPNHPPTIPSTATYAPAMPPPHSLRWIGTMINPVLRTTLPRLTEKSRSYSTWWKWKVCLILTSLNALRKTDFPIVPCVSEKTYHTCFRFILSLIHSFIHSNKTLRTLVVHQSRTKG